MSKKIKLTEEQLKKVINVIGEQAYDQALTTHKREQAREVFMSRDNAQLLNNLAQNWCEGRVNHPDCAELEEITKKLKLDNF